MGKIGILSTICLILSFIAYITTRQERLALILMSQSRGLDTSYQNLDKIIGYNPLPILLLIVGVIGLIYSLTRERLS